MCGIVGYIGHRQAYPILIKGLQRLEYRGYDSAGIALLDGDIMNYKRKGKVADLEQFCKGKNIKSTIGIGHTRWATHGVPNDVNAHPHYSQDKSISIIHILFEKFFPCSHSFVSNNKSFPAGAENNKPILTPSAP